MQRTYIKDALDKIGKQITINGWVETRRDHGKLIFLDVRDVTGLVQIVVNPKVKADAHTQAETIRNEFVIAVTGLVKERPPNLVNPNLETGKIEIEVADLKVLAESEALPFGIDSDGYEISEEVRMKYRYIDLRRQRLKKNLIARHKVIKYIRDFLLKQDFIEIETPILSKSTPEGARDYLVPSRNQPGKFYALPQSPQQYKQLLMVAGLEKYFQIARCFRDEDTRGDRQPEFTQLDLEISFPTQDQILNIIEELYIEITERIVGKKVLEKPFPKLTHKEAMDRFGNDSFDLRKEKNPDVLAFAWVVDFPLFEKTETREIVSSHHPFTAPKDEDIPLLDKDPMKVKSWQHDLVCNGFEIGGGSIRITNPEIQKKIFKILGHSEEEIERKFGHLLTAFKYGVPPHGGIAMGLDRFIAILMNEPNIREVIAFPKTGDGRDLLMNSPSEVDDKQLKELNLKPTK